MEKPLLSICIPTYNRGSTIAETLDSIVGQIEAEVEVVISDNASTDRTLECVKRYQNGKNPIRYSRSEINQGFDLNVIRVMQLATGKYCWFLGSDDRLEPGALSKVLKTLKANQEVGGASLGVNTYDKDLKEKITAWNPTLGKYHKPTVFGNTEECLSVLGHYFGHFSALIINREIWQKVYEKNEWQAYCDGFIHVYMAIGTLLAAKKWIFIPDSCVGWRGQNDQLLSSIGYYRRLKFDVVGYEKITGDLLGRGSRSYRNITKIGLTLHMNATVLNARIGRVDAVSWIKMFWLCLRYYWRFPIFWITVVPIFIVPRWSLVKLKEWGRKYKEYKWGMK